MEKMRSIIYSAGSDVILLDLRIPKIDGLKVLEKRKRSEEGV
ncbi:MAG: hypothetical protein MASP_01834 [Candidatus Methanolliviera sp. GoM_asphalt]|nr:MAG: hypothetical protein MASP_01834 [Candidatus Methanolliviera sp. GoM_asphalt]